MVSHNDSSINITVPDEEISAMPIPSPLSFMADELKALKHNWFWFLALGIALVVVGLLAILMPFVAGIYATVLIAIFLLIGGVAQIIGSFQSRGWGAFFLELLMGIIYLVTGFLMLEQP